MPDTICEPNSINYYFGCIENILKLYYVYYCGFCISDVGGYTTQVFSNFYNVHFIYAQ